MGKLFPTDPLSLFSHELKTPISSLKLALDLIRKDNLPQKDKKELLGLMDEEIQKMTDFIDEALDLRLLKEKGDLMKFQWEVLGDLIARSVKPFELTAKQKNIQWRIENLREDVEVFMDSLWIKQALNNLISNALKHTPPQSTVTLFARRTPSGALRIAVRDRGRGIPTEEKKHIFKAFYKRRVENPKKGLKNTGLGLAITQMIVEKHEGFIDVSSEKEGSTFYFELPKVRQAKKAA